jgi:hypothetical protein
VCLKFALYEYANQLIDEAFYHFVTMEGSIISSLSPYLSHVHKLKLFFIHPLGYLLIQTPKKIKPTNKFLVILQNHSSSFFLHQTSVLCSCVNATTSLEVLRFTSSNVSKNCHYHHLVFCSYRWEGSSHVYEINHTLLFQSPSLWIVRWGNNLFNVWFQL